jgi:hypothetical protein
MYEYFEFDYENAIFDWDDDKDKARYNYGEDFYERY